MADKSSDPSASEQIDAIIQGCPDWRGEMLAQLRAVIRAADPAITEDVKWKKPSKPEGVAVWVCQGNICIADILKNAVRLTFPKGAQLSDPQGLFNARLDSSTVRAIDYFQGDPLNEPELTALLHKAIEQC